MNTGYNTPTNAYNSTLGTMLMAKCFNKKMTKQNPNLYYCFILRKSLFFWENIETWSLGPPILKNDNKFKRVAYNNNHSVRVHSLFIHFFQGLTNLLVNNLLWLSIVSLGSENFVKDYSYRTDWFLFSPDPNNQDPEATLSKIMFYRTTERLLNKE